MTLWHVCRVVHCANFGCHALLVGVGGSLCRSRVFRLYLPIHCMQIVINAGYDETQFPDDLREMYNAAGLKDEGTVPAHRLANGREIFGVPERFAVQWCHSGALHV